jgi:protein translocase SecG subunit
MVVLALVLVVLLQRSEGGALGMGGGGGGGGLMSGRGTANVLTRATAILAVVVLRDLDRLSLIASNEDRPGSILDAASCNGSDACARLLIPTLVLKAAEFLIRSRPNSSSPPVRRFRPLSKRFRWPAAGNNRQQMPCDNAQGIFMCLTKLPSGQSALGNDMVLLHGAIHFHHRRRGFLARQRSRIRSTRRAAPGARIQGSASESSIPI